MYQTDFRNVKADVLTRMFNFIFKNVNDERNRFQHQIILIFNCLEIHAIEIEKNFIDQEIIDEIFQFIDILTSTLSKKSSTIEISNRSVISVAFVSNISLFNSNIIYNRVLTTNKKNTKCFKYREIINKNRIALKSINITNCTIEKNVLYRDDQL